MKLKGMILAVAILGLGLGACTKKVEVKDSDIEGALVGAFEVTEGEYEVQKDDNGVSYISVEIKRTDESVPYTDKNISVFSQTTKEVFTQAGFGYVTFGKGDVQMANVSPKDNGDSIDEQLAILKLKKGEKGNLTIKFKDAIPASVKLTSDLDIVNTGEIALHGSIGQYGTKNFTLELNVKDKDLSGKYQYLTSPKGAFLYLNGKLLSQKVDDDEYVYKVNIQEAPDRFSWSGEFDGSLILKRDDDDKPYYYLLTGSFLSYQMKTYQYNLKSDPLGE